MLAAPGTHMSIAPAPDTNAFSRLFRMAVLGGVEAAVRLHVERGDNLEARDERGLTPLMLAASKNRSSVCRILLEAGADAFAVDPSGRNALDIAMAAEADEAARVIESHICRSDTESSKSNPEHQAIGTSTAQMPETGLVPAALDSASLMSGMDSVADEPVSNGRHQNQMLEGLASPNSEFIDDYTSFDISGWEAEEPSLPPPESPSILTWQIETQKVIATHAPLDDSADWEHFDTFLPSEAAPLPRSNDTDYTDRLRRILLRVLREGSIPEMALDELFAEREEEVRQGVRSLLRYCINDMGAETDERFEYLAPHESFEVFVDPRESETEGESIGDALTFLDNLEARGNDPMRLYMKEVYRTCLLSADEEIALAKAMETAESDAIGALSAWPEGLRWALVAIDSALASGRPLGAITMGRRDNPEPESIALFEEDDLNDGVSMADSDPVSDFRPASTDEELIDGSPTEDLSHAAGSHGFGIRIKALAASLELDRDSMGLESERRATLESLRLQRTVLLELADLEQFLHNVSARPFVAATQRLSNARSRMAGANLRLVLTVAKRYLPSGLPMDDLVQEGNIGLLKAVDKFDWRRGYRFSTMAIWWIRQQISRSVADDSRTIRLPVHVYDQLQRFEKKSNVIECSKGREPSTVELATTLSLQLDKVEALQRLAAPIASLHDEDAQGELIYGAIEDGAPDPFESVATVELRATLGAILTGLGGKHERVLRMRFGVGVNEAFTLEEVGTKFEVTRERIRQIEAEALRRLRKRRIREMLRGWVPQDAPDDNALTEPSKDRAGANPAPTRLTGDTKPSHKNLATDEKPERREERNKNQQSSAIDRILAEAAALGIAIEEDQNGVEHSTWVNIDKPIDAQTRTLIRKLVRLGFQHWPGKGYWI